MTRQFIIAILMIILTAGAAGARPDPRIRSTPYVENAVVSLMGHFGFQMVIEFNDDETIENVAIGDSVSWQITPNRRGDVLILKPISAAAPTNMTVVTTMRRYTFALEAQSAAEAQPNEMTFVLRFIYPQLKEGVDAAEAQAIADAEADEPTSAETAMKNKNYSYEGSREIIPSQIFDDGRSTYFQWPARAPTPAIFLVSNDGKESVINHGYVDGYIVVDRVAPVFSLKHGDYETLIYNDGFTPVDPGPDAPRLRPKKRGFFGKVFGGDEEEES